MRQLTLTNKQFDVLFDILRDTVDVIEGDEYKVGKMLETTDEKWLTWM